MSRLHSFALILMLGIAIPIQVEIPLVIAHRGSSGYLPEHTLAAYALAYGQGADFIEQDIVLTKDSIPIVLHDIHLETVTDVKKKFPARKRGDGRYYAIDFSLAEIKQLNVHERIDAETGKRVYPNRFPMGQGKFSVPTLTESIELIQGMNQSTGRTVGIYPEIKQPKWHRDTGYDISVIVLKVLSDKGYASKQDPVFLQCFDASELIRIRHDLGCQLKLIQLIGSSRGKSDDASRMLTADGIQDIAGYADGIGPSLNDILQSDAAPGANGNLISLAHAQGLEVHGYTFRADSLPDSFGSFAGLVKEFHHELQVDGYFTDFPDQVLQALEEQ